MTRSALVSIVIAIGALLAPVQPVGSLPPVNYTLGADSQPQPGVATGTVTK